MNFDTHTIDHLFLELSQFTKATTAKELRLQQEVADLIDEKSSTQVWVTGLEQKLRAPRIHRLNLFHRRDAAGAGRKMGAGRTTGNWKMRPPPPPVPCLSVLLLAFVFAIIMCVIIIFAGRVFW